MERLKGLLAAVKVWVEAHALGVGTAGLAALLVGGGVGIAGLTSGGGTTTATTGGNVAPSTVTTQTSDATSGSTIDTIDPGAVSGDGSPLIAVRIDNAPEARPQMGIADASLIVETPVEGGMTRFTAFFPAGAETVVVGPVRSLRPVDADLIAPFATTVAATGGQPFVLQGFDGAGIAMALPDTAPGFTALERPAPHNLFVRLSEIESVYPPRAVDEPGMPEGEFTGGAAAETVTVPLASEVTWQYSESGYARSEAGQSFEILDEPDGDVSQFVVDTVVVMFAAERSAGYSDSNDVDVPTFDVIGSGRLLVFHGGEVVAGTWFRSAQEDAYRFVAENGSELGIPAGRTHLMVVPRELELDY